MIIDNIICKQCRRRNTIIENFTEGFLVCTECGLVAEESLVDQSGEWRTFEDSQVNMARCDVNKNPYFKESTVNLFINNKKRFNAQGAEARLKKTLSTISNDAYQLGFTQSTIGIATDIAYVACEKIGRFGSFDALRVAVLYLACRKDNAPVPVKKLSIIIGQENMPMKKINKYILKLAETIKIDYDEEEGLARMFGGQLEYDQKDIERAVELARSYKKRYDKSREPVTVAIGCLAAVNCATKGRARLDINELKKVSNVAKSTILSCMDEVFACF